MMKNLLPRRGNKDGNLLVEWRFNHHETGNDRDDKNATLLSGDLYEMNRSSGTTSTRSRSLSMDHIRTEQQSHLHQQPKQQQQQQAWRSVLKFPPWKRSSASSATREDCGGFFRSPAMTMLTMEDEIDFMASLELTDALSCLQMELRNKVAECETLQEKSTRLSNRLTKREKEYEEKSVELERLQFRMQSVTFLDSPNCAKKVIDDRHHDRKQQEQNQQVGHSTDMEQDKRDACSIVEFSDGDRDEIHPTASAVQTTCILPPLCEPYPPPTRLSQAQVDEILKERDMAIARADHLAGILSKTKQENDRLEGLLRKTKAMFQIAARTTLATASALSSSSSTIPTTASSQGGGSAFPGIPFGRFIRKGMVKNSDPLVHLERFETSPSGVAVDDGEEKEEEKSILSDDDDDVNESLCVPHRNGSSRNLFCQRLEF